MHRDRTAEEDHGPTCMQDLTVVIPTRDRGDSVLRPVRSILSNLRIPAAVIVIDQSVNDLTETALLVFRDNPKVSYRRTSSRGLSAALNEGIGHAVTPYVAITGDDCRAGADFPGGFIDFFQAHPDAAVAFGSVLSNPEAPRHSFSPCYVVHTPVVTRNLNEKHSIGGTSACMAVRRSCWDTLRGFDPMFGVGAPLQAGEETDLTIRALNAGFGVGETPVPSVVHLSTVRYENRAELIRRNWYGTGAAFAKAVRRGQLRILIALCRLAVRWIQGRSSVLAGIGAGGYRWRTLVAFSRGFFNGITRQVDNSLGHFIPTSRERLENSPRTDDLARKCS